MKQILCVGRIGPYPWVGQDKRKIVITSVVNDEPYHWRVLLDTEISPEDLKQMTTFCLREMFAQLSEQRGENPS